MLQCWVDEPINWVSLQSAAGGDLGQHKQVHTADSINHFPIGLLGVTFNTSASTILLVIASVKIAYITPYTVAHFLHANQLLCFPHVVAKEFVVSCR